jgi:hypothetical protein
MSFTRDKAATLSTSRKPFTTAALLSLLHLPQVTEAPNYRILRSVGTRKYPTKGYCTYAVQTENEIEALVTELYNESFTSRPERKSKRAVLYLSHRSADAELREEPLIADLIKAEPNAAFFACDVRGIGDSQPNTCGANTFLAPYGNHYFYAAHGLMLGKPLLGQRTFDVLRVIDFLVASGHKEIHLAARGWGTLPASFAAVLSAKVKQVTLKNALTSYADIIANEDATWPYATLLPNALQHFDLPEVYAQLKSKGLTMIEPWGASDGMKG